MTTDLWSAFAATVKRRGVAPALVCNDTVTSFSAWMARSETFRVHLQAHDLQPGERVLLLIRNTPDIAAALTAIWAEGAIAVLVDESVPSIHLDHIIDTVSPRLLLHAGVMATVEEASSRIESFELRELDSRSNNSHIPHVSLPTDSATIVFTSGSTGRPKGVTQSHGNLCRGASAVAAYLGLRDDDRILCPVPWSFDYGLGQILSTIIFGHTHVIPGNTTPAGVCAAIQQHRPSVLGGIPSLYSYLVSGLSPIRDIVRDSVRLIMNTGSAIPAPVLAELREYFPKSLVYLNYGLTETYRSCYLPPRFVETRFDSIGIPIPGVDIAIVGEDGALVPAGCEGEIVHRGDYITLGYWNDSESSAIAIRPDPHVPAGAPHPGRALFTGDIGRRDSDGFVYFHCRRDHQIKSMGVRVSSEEVESLLLESGLVTDAAVFGVPHDVIGQEIWAAVVANRTGSDAIKEIERYSRRTMSKYMVPRRYLVQSVLPRTSSGKVDYPRLLELANGIPTPGLTVGGTNKP